MHSKVSSNSVIPFRQSSRLLRMKKIPLKKKKAKIYFCNIKQNTKLHMYNVIMIPTLIILQTHIHPR